MLNLKRLMNGMETYKEMEGKSDSDVLSVMFARVETSEGQEGHCETCLKKLSDFTEYFGRYNSSYCRQHALSSARRELKWNVENGMDGNEVFELTLQ